MADFNGMARTNTFRVKDKEAFLSAISVFDLEVQWRTLKDGAEGVCLITNDEYGSWPGYWCDDDGDEHESDWVALLSEHLVDGEVAIINEAGHEKARYVSGWSLAIHSSGKAEQISLNDIYEKAAASFGVPVDAISECSY